MEINFVEEAKKRDKLHKLFDFCVRLVPKSQDTHCVELALKYPGFHCTDIYEARGGNNVTARVYPRSDYWYDVHLNSKVNDSPPRYENLCALVDLNTGVMFLFGGNGSVMRTAEGEFVEVIDWIDCDLHTPKSTPEISLDIRKELEEDYDIFYADNVPVLKFPEDPIDILKRAFGDAIKNAEREEQKSKFKLIKHDDILSDDEKIDSKVK